MTQEEKQLLLIDLCARLSYGVIVDYKENEFEIPHWKITTIHPDTMDGWIGYNKRIGSGTESGGKHFNIGEIKPYLRPISSMTNEEAVNYHSIDTYSIRGDMVAKIDFYLKHHFDFRLTPERLSMIEAGLALEALEGMYEV